MIDVELVWDDNASHPDNKIEELIASTKHNDVIHVGNESVIFGFRVAHKKEIINLKFSCGDVYYPLLPNGNFIEYPEFLNVTERYIETLLDLRV